MANNDGLNCIRAGTEHDLADAGALAERVLAKTKKMMDRVTYELSKELFTAVALYVVYNEAKPTFKEVADFLVDPTWDSEKQMLVYFRHCDKSFQQKEAAHWIAGFVKKMDRLPDVQTVSLVKRCHAQWTLALGLGGEAAKRNAKPRSSILVFNPETVGKALTTLSYFKDEKKLGADLVLESAQVNGGYRSVPNAKKAVEKLEVAKSVFENLVEPISRLQIDLSLSGAMKPADFRVTPILLLGDPGIGKTFLATQLAKALGVNMEKMSAGGAQGGFQLTGSHSSWQSARPGLLSTLLATGKSAAPVVVIDEVDKIHDAQYPVLPVLLDLLEPDTGRCFKDEFFEMSFDASRIVFVMTANSLDDVPTPLLSRVEVFDVARPQPAQRLRIIQETMKHLCLETKKQIELDIETGEILAERVDLDLRKTTRMVREAFTRAMNSDETVAKLIVPKCEYRLAVGFGRSDKSAFER